MSKLQAKDLMIGDWVCFDGDTEHENPVQIDGISTEEACVDGDWYDIWEPIPITVEILEKNGFVKELDSDGIHYRFTLIKGCSQFSLLYARCVFQWLCPIDFKYVHQLQHALKVVGIEKEIQL